MRQISTREKALILAATVAAFVPAVLRAQPFGFPTPEPVQVKIGSTTATPNTITFGSGFGGSFDGGTAIVYTAGGSGSTFNGTRTLNALGATVDAGYTAINSTAATSGVPAQNGPAFRSCGAAWNGTASVTGCSYLYTSPIAAATSYPRTVLRGSGPGGMESAWHLFWVEPSYYGGVPTPVIGAEGVGGGESLVLTAPNQIGLEAGPYYSMLIWDPSVSASFGPADPASFDLANWRSLTVSRAGVGSTLVAGVYSSNPTAARPVYDGGASPVQNGLAYEQAGSAWGGDGGSVPVKSAIVLVPEPGASAAAVSGHWSFRGQVGGGTNPYPEVAAINVETGGLTMRGAAAAVGSVSTTTEPTYGTSYGAVEVRSSYSGSLTATRMELVATNGVIMLADPDSHYAGLRITPAGGITQLTYWGDGPAHTWLTSPQTWSPNTDDTTSLGSPTGAFPAGRWKYLHVSRGVQERCVNALETCNATNRGLKQILCGATVDGGAGGADTPQVCLKTATDTYAWTAL